LVEGPSYTVQARSIVVLFALRGVVSPLSVPA
jgi:hypothetical protein